MLFFIIIIIIHVASLGYSIICGEKQLIKLDSLRRTHLSLVIGSTQHKESSVCLDENVDGLDVMRAKGMLRRRAASLMC